MGFGATTVAADNAVEFETSANSLLYTEIEVESSTPFHLPKQVTLEVDGQTINALTFERTLADFINEQGVVLGGQDEIYPPLTFILTEENFAEVIRVEKSSFTTQEKISYDTKEIEDATIEDGIKVVSQEGKEGLKELVYEKVLKNGVLVATNLISTTVLEQPQDKIVKLGTKIVPKTEVIDGKTITYYKKLWVWATSYDGNCYGCNGTTATGAKLKFGIIAADPKVIPWHTKMYVPGYGFGQMEDTGGALKKATTYGKIHIDLGFEDVSKGWWSSRYTWAYLLVK